MLFMRSLLQILEENEERVKKIRQETEQAKEGWEKVQIDKDKDRIPINTTKP